MSVFEWKFGSYISLFRPFLLSLFNVPNRHIHKYSCLLAKVLYWFHGLVPGLTLFGIYYDFLVFVIFL